MLLSETLVKLAAAVTSNPMMVDRQKSINFVRNAADDLVKTIENMTDAEVATSAVHVQNILLELAGICQLGEDIQTRISSK